MNSVVAGHVDGPSREIKRERKREKQCERQNLNARDVKGTLAAFHEISGDVWSSQDTGVRLLSKDVRTRKHRHLHVGSEDTFSFSPVKGEVC